MRIALVTSTPYQHLDEDLPLLREAAARQGVDADVVLWDAEGVDWAAYDAVAVRSCWDYLQRREEFLAWAATVPNLHNHHDVLVWNTDKRYLQQLHTAGIPIIPTLWNVAPGDDIGDADEWVVKPSISGGSKDTARWATREQVWEHSAELTAAGRTSMTQPYLSSVDTEGETALLFFNGQFSHAIRKGPLLQAGEGVRQDRDMLEVITEREPTDQQTALAERVLSTTTSLLALDRPPLYARVDLLKADNGSPVLIELELTEPSLFLPYSRDGAARFIEAVLAHA
jgi:hypothetical protein